MTSQHGVRRETFGAVVALEGLVARLERLAAVLLQLLLRREALLAGDAPVGAFARVRPHVAHHGCRVDRRVTAELAHQLRGSVSWSLTCREKGGKTESRYAAEV